MALSEDFQIGKLALFLSPIVWLLKLKSMIQIKPYLLAFLLLSCSEEKIEPLNDFELSKNKWEALAVDSYSYTFQISCFCRREATLPKAVQVVNGKIVKVDGASYDEDEHWGVQTIDQLFDLIEEAEKDKVHRLEAEYDPDKGYPTSVYIDRELMMADEEMGYYVSALKY